MECPAPHPIKICFAQPRALTGFGTQTFVSVPSPHIPCSFHPQEKHWPPEREDRKYRINTTETAAAAAQKKQLWLFLKSRFVKSFSI